MAELRLRRTRRPHLLLITFPAIPVLPEPVRPAHPTNTLAPFFWELRLRLCSLSALGCLVHKVPSLLQSMGAQCSARWASGKNEPPSLTLILDSPAVALVSGVLCAGLEALEPLCNFGIWELMFWISSFLQINLTCRTWGKGC